MLMRSNKEESCGKRGGGNQKPKMGNLQDWTGIKVDLEKHRRLRAEFFKLLK